MRLLNKGEIGDKQEFGERLLHNNIMNDEIRDLFLNLKVIGQRSAISSEAKREKDLKLIAVLRSFIEKKIVCDFEDVGFCYWNIYPIRNPLMIF